MSPDYLHGIIYFARHIHGHSFNVLKRQPTAQFLHRHICLRGKSTTCFFDSSHTTQRYSSSSAAVLKFIFSFCFQVLSRSPLPSGVEELLRHNLGKQLLESVRELSTVKLLFFIVCTCVRHSRFELVSWLRLLKYSISKNVGS